MADAPPPSRPVEFVDLVLAIMGVGLIPLIIGLLAFVTIPKDNMPLLASVVSFVTGVMVGTVINNRFGSSKSSDQKTDTLSAIATKATE